MADALTPLREYVEDWRRGGTVLISRDAAKNMVRCHDALRAENAELRKDRDAWCETCRHAEDCIAAIEVELATLRAAPASEEVRRIIDTLKAQWPIAALKIESLSRALAAAKHDLAFCQSINREVGSGPSARDTLIAKQRAELAAATARAEAAENYLRDMGIHYTFVPKRAAQAPEQDGGR